MGQLAKITVLQGPATDNTEDASPYLHIPYTALPHQGVCKSPHGAICAAKCFAHR